MLRFERWTVIRVDLYSAATNLKGKGPAKHNCQKQGRKKKTLSTRGSEMGLHNDLTSEIYSVSVSRQSAESLETAAAELTNTLGSVYRCQLSLCRLYFCSGYFMHFTLFSG